MDQDWGRRPDIIDGEYEVLEERYIDDEYYGREQFVEINPKPPYVTYTLLMINVVTWLIMSFTGLLFGWDMNTQLLYFGAKVNGLIVRGQYWRLITAMFLHIGILHLFFNSYALYMYGPIVEKLYGKIKYVLVYILSGLMGSVLSYAFSPNPSAGASGAIFGLMGSLLYFRKQKKRLFQRIFGPGLLIIIGINLFYGFVQPGIDNWGHIGGLIGGYIISKGLGLYRDRKISMNKTLAWVIFIILIISGLKYGDYKYGREVYLDYAYSALRNGDLEAAERYVDKAAKGAYDDERVKQMFQAIYIQKAENDLRNGDVEGALESINFLLEHYPDDINLLFIRAHILEQKGDYEGALEDYLRVADVEKGFAEVWLRAGRAAYNLGKLADAREYLEKSLEIDPGLQEAKDMLDQLNSMI